MFHSNFVKEKGLFLCYLLLILRLKAFSVVEFLLFCLLFNCLHNRSEVCGS